MSQKKTVTFLEACHAVQSLGAIEFEGGAFPPDAVREVAVRAQEAIWKICTKSDPSLRRDLYLQLLQLNREIGLPTISPESVLGNDAIADGYTLPAQEGGAE